jgi:hypothetical protein
MTNYMKEAFSASACALSKNPTLESLRSPPWSPASGGNEVVGDVSGWGGCLRGAGWMAASVNGLLAAHGYIGMVPAYAV